MSIHRIIHIKEKITTAIAINAMCIPTLFLRSLSLKYLLTQFQINENIFNVLMLYGVFTTIIGTTFFLFAI